MLSLEIVEYFSIECSFQSKFKHLTFHEPNLLLRSLKMVKPRLVYWSLVSDFFFLTEKNKKIRLKMIVV